MPRGASPKREREYEEIEQKLEKENRYPGRNKEVAARIVNKQRREAGETLEQRGQSKKQRAARGRSASSRRKKATGASRTRTTRSSSRRTAKGAQTTGRRTAKQSQAARTARTSEGRGGARSGRSSSKARSSSSKAGTHSSSKLTHYTIDHDQIRRWAEERGGKPSHVIRTGRGKRDAGILRIDFPGYTGAGSLEPISWDSFFDKFDQSKLALAYQDRTARGQKSNFNKLVSRGSVPSSALH